MRRKNKLKPRRMRPIKTPRAKAAALTLSPLPRPARHHEPERKYSRIWP